MISTPKKRKKGLYEKIREDLAKIFHSLAKQKESRIIEGSLCPDHAHMCIEIPPKIAVASVIGFLKEKSAIAIARTFQGRKQNYTGASFRARGYAVSTIGFDEDIIKKYIQEQNDNENGRFFYTLTN